MGLGMTCGYVTSLHLLIRFGDLRPNKNNGNTLLHAQAYRIFLVWCFLEDVKFRGKKKLQIIVIFKSKIRCPVRARLPPPPRFLSTWSRHMGTVNHLGLPLKSEILAHKRSIMACKIILAFVVLIFCLMHNANGGFVELLSGALKSVFGEGRDRFINSTENRNKTDRSKLEKQVFQLYFDKYKDIRCYR